MRLNLSVAIVDMVVTLPRNYSLSLDSEDVIEAYFYIKINRNIDDDDIKNITFNDNVCPFENGTEVIAVCVISNNDNNRVIVNFVILIYTTDLNVCLYRTVNLIGTKTKRASFWELFIGVRINL